MASVNSATGPSSPSNSKSTLQDGLLLAPGELPVQAGFTLRGGGVSEGPCASLNLALHVDDNPAAVHENRRRLVEQAGLAEAPRWLRQVHGTRVVHGDAVQPDLTEADAVWSDRPGQVCAVLIADCVPVLLADRSGRCVAAVHAGWRGLAAGIIPQTIATLPAPAAALIAHIGPCIGRDAYQVGPEVIQQIARAGVEPVCQPSAPTSTTVPAAASAGDRAVDRAPDRSPRFQLDLAATAHAILLKAGVGQVSTEDRCTCSDPSRFFSYRRDGITGRFAAYVACRG